MSIEQALLDAIWAEPHDNTHRVVYADRLEEIAESESHRARAEPIRVQCALSQLNGDDPQYDALEAREQEILKQWEKTWWQQMPRGSRRGSFVRGFPVPSLGRFSLQGLVQLDESRLRAAPTWRYHYGVHGADLDPLLQWPCLHRLEMFALRPPLPDGWAQRLAACDNLRQVVELALIDCQVTEADLSLLLNTWAKRHLTDIQVEFDAAVLAQLGAHPIAAGLRRLALSYSKLSAETVQALTTARHFTVVTRLVLSGNPLGDAGLSELLRWPRLSGVRRLFLGGCGLTDRAAEELAACPAVANLRELGISHNQLGEAGARAFAESPHLGRLQNLGVFANPLCASRSARAALRQRFGKNVRF